MIQTHTYNDRNERVELSHNEPAYWEGPYRYEHFPVTVFKAGLGESYQHPVSRIVASERELQELQGRDPGWKDTPDEARAYLDACEADMAKAAAEHNFGVTKMSEKAQAEALAYDRSTDDLVADVPVKRGPGRPKKESVS